MTNICNRVAGELSGNRRVARRAAILSGATALAAVLSLTPLSFSSHANVIGLASAFAQSGSSTATPSPDDMSAGAQAGDDRGVDAVGHDAGDDKGVDVPGHDAGDDNGVDAPAHDAGDDNGVDAA